MMKTKLLFIVVIILSLSCGIAYRNKVYTDFENYTPKKIAIFVDYKSILERSAGFEQFSPESVFPDTIDRGSSLGYKKNSKEGNFLSENKISKIFDLVLQKKGYTVEDRSSIINSKSKTISDIINSLKDNFKQNVDAFLFVDYSDMFNTYFARKGVSNNPGHAIYYKYGLFDLSSGQILIRYSEVLHPGFYHKSDYSKDEISNQIAELLIEDLNRFFPEYQNN